MSISGGQKPAVRIQVNPTALASYGIGLEDVRTALATANVDQAKGTLDGPRQSYTIGANDQLLSGDEYRSIVVAYRNGAPVRLDRCRHDCGRHREHLSSRMDEHESSGHREHPAPTRRQHHWRRRPHQETPPRLQDSLPAAVKMQILTDRTETIRASVKDVQFELMLTIGLVVMVIFLFLRNLSATIIPSVAVPLSLVGTFAVMYLLGYSLNNLTLMALTISTGFVVDDAIVMIENIDRFWKKGDSPWMRR